MTLVSFPLAAANAVQVPLNVVVDWARQAAIFSRTNDTLALRDLISTMEHYGIGMSYWGDAVRRLAVGYGIAYPERVDLPALNRNLPGNRSFLQDPQELWLRYRKQRFAPRSIITQLAEANRNDVLRRIIDWEFEYEHPSTPGIDALGSLILEREAQQACYRGLQESFQNMPTGRPEELVDSLTPQLRSHLGNLLDAILESGKGPVTRYYAVSLLPSLANNRSPRAKIKSLPQIIERGLADEEPLIVLKTLEVLRHITPKLVSRIHPHDISWQKWKPLTESPEFGIKRYLYGSPLQRAARRQVLSYILDDYILEEKVLPVSLLRPIHSLADYHPDPSHRHNGMKKQCERLQTLTRRYGYDRDRVFRDYFDLPGPFALEAMFTSRLPVLGGHRHIAGLLKAASQGVIPEAWLDEGIPVKIVYYTGKFPKQLLSLFLTLGTELTWSDLFPQENGCDGL